jgi:hypothetical protein
LKMERRSSASSQMYGTPSMLREIWEFERFGDDGARDMERFGDLVIW